MTGKRNQISVGFINLGCPKNLVDSEYMASALMSAGMTLARRPEEADVVIVNTCAFVEDAREESVDAILEACELKKQGPCRGVIVSGCFTQRYHRQAASSLPEVDAFVGLDHLDDIVSTVERVGGGERGISAVGGEAKALFEPIRRKVIFSGGTHAYVKVADGCDHRCAFCAVPLIRGRYRSRGVAGLVSEVQNLVAQGIREIELVSQDTAMYGSDRSDGSTLPALLQELNALDGRFRLRVLYVHPSHVGDDLLRSMASLPKVCRYLDVPVQHSHPGILKAMGRPVGKSDAVRTLPERARNIMPDIALRTSLIVGFPGETEEHFADLIAYVREVRFDHVGVFVYSPEEGTRALKLEGQVAKELAEERRGRLMVAQQEIVAEKGRKRIGLDDEILLEERASHGPAGWIGRSRGQAPDIDGVTIVRGLPRREQRGGFVMARYTGIRGYDMLARFIGQRESA